MHGWGANAQDLASLTPYLNLENYYFVFPNAPFPYSYGSGGKAWYDLAIQGEGGLAQIQDRAGLAQSRQLLIDWLLALESQTGIPLEATILAGFSQGGAMTLEVGLDLPLAGLVVLSGYMHQRDRPFPATFPPILIIHGTQDGVVPIAAARHAQAELIQAGATVEYQEFPMQHEISREAIARVRTFLTSSPLLKPR